MSPVHSPNRCRIVLIAPDMRDPAALAALVGAACAGGDVASLILPAYGADEALLQRLAEPVTEIAQGHGAAMVLAGESRVAARIKADGVHVEGGRAALDDAIDRLQPRMIVGAGGAKTRDDALDLGEARPDYMFFGRFGYDTKPEPHRRNLQLGQWWAEMIQIPCIVLAGSTIGSVLDVAATGADFVALSSAVFAEGVDPAAAVAEANALLDASAPRFEE